MQNAPTRPPKTSRRKRVIILLAMAVFVLLAILVSQTAFDLTFLRPGNNQQIVVFAALSALIFLLFVALTFVLFRNLLKLFAERRLGVLGSKFRTRMVAGAFRDNAEVPYAGVCAAELTEAGTQHRAAIRMAEGEEGLRALIVPPILAM